jgi:membrane protease YdiL (CAAX protease family)
MVNSKSHNYILKTESSNAFKIFLSILTIALCFFIPHYANLTIFIYPVVVLIVVWLYLKYISKENFSDIFFSFKRFGVKAIWIGIIAAILLSLFFRFAWDPFINSIIPSGKIDLSDFASIRNNPVNYAIILLLALLVGGFYEEIIFHGFIFTRLEKIFKGKWATITAFMLTTVIFGLYHFQQGLKGILLTAIAGAVYHVLILKFNRNLWYGIFVHAFFDFIGLTLIYLGKLS